MTETRNGTGPLDTDPTPRTVSVTYSEAAGSTYQIQSVVFPDKSYIAFTYDSGATSDAIAYGNLTAMRLRTGAWIRYTTYERPTCSRTPALWQTQKGFSIAPQNGQIAQRVVDADGPTPQTWNYSYGSSPQPSIVSGPAGSSKYTLDSFSSGTNICGTRVTSIEDDGLDGTLLRTKNFHYTTYDNPLAFGGLPELYGSQEKIAFPDQITVSQPGVADTVTTTTYPFTFNGSQPYELGDTAGSYWTESDQINIPYGLPQTSTITGDDGASGTLSKTVTTHYYWEGHPTYLQANLFDLVTSMQVSGTGGNSVTTTLTYDEPTLNSPSGAFGNLTTSTTTGPQGGTHTLQKGYDSLGRVTQAVDGNLSKSFFYNQASSGFPSTVTLPSTSGVSHQTSFAWDANTNQLISQTDDNGISTLYKYHGPLGELSSIEKAIGQTSAHSLTALAYPNPNVATTNADLVSYSDGKLASEQDFDQLGRLSKSVLVNGSTISYGYDTANRISSVSNPYTSTQNGGTQYHYDPSGLSVSECYPDGSCKSWSKNGNAVYFTDEASDRRHYTYDVLGRLVRVDQSNFSGAAIGGSTRYVYDIQGNLDSVSQSGTGSESTRNRSFTYDSLSRLLTSTNPESGTICYGSWTTNGCAGGYDGNGNLLMKTDARGVVTNYTYDALNRVTSKSYSDGSRAQHFAYDGKDESGADLGAPWNVNAVGRLSHTSDQTSVASTYAYDVVGRLVEKADCLPSRCDNSDTQTTVYDLAGNLSSFIYPDGRRVNNTYDSAGRMSGVSYGAWNANPKNASYFDASTNAYDPAGHLVGGTFGNGVGLVAAYDSRQRIGTLAYGTTSQLLWGRNYGWTPNSNMSNWTDVISGTQRQFGYDSLNRLTSAVDLFSTTGAGQGQTSSSSSYQVSLRFTNDLCDCGSGGTGDRNLYVQSVSIGSETQPGSGAWSYDTSCNVNGALLCNGTMTATFHQLGPVKVTAYGSTALGVGPHMQVLVNGTLMGEWDVTTTSATYITTASVSNVPNAGATPVSTPPQWTDPDESNLLVNADTPGASGWYVWQANLTNGKTAPDGSLTAFSAVASSGSTDSFLSVQAPSNTLVDGETMTGSVWLRSPQGNLSFNLYLVEDGPAGTDIPASKPVLLTTAWQQFQLSGFFHVGHDSLHLQIGGGGTLTSGQSIELWGAKLEDTGRSGRTVTNYALHSQRLTATSWTYAASAASDGYGVAPDGSNSAAIVVATAQSNDSRFSNNVALPTMSALGPITGSIWLRSSGGAQTIRLSLLADGGATLAYTSVSVTSDWSRFSVTAQNVATLTGVQLLVGGANSFGYGRSLQVWGAQMELASSAGPYVATGGAAASIGTNLTNLLAYSSLITGPTWGGQQTQLVSSNVPAPDGTSTAMEVAGVSGATDAYLTNVIQQPSLYDGQQATGSVFLRVPSGTASVNLYFLAINAQGWQWLGQQTVSVDTIWRRFTFSATLPTGMTRLWMQIGGGNTVGAGAHLDVWGSQVELGSFAGPYVPTSSLPVLSGQELVNILPSSQNLSGPSWGMGNAAVTQNSATAPDGTQTAATVTAWSGSTDSYAGAYVPNPSLYDGQTMTGSVYLRVPSGSLSLRLHMVNVAGTVLGASGTNITVTTAWQRFSFTQTVPNGLQFLSLQIGGANTFTSGQVLQVWGAQMTPGSSPAPYTPTSTTVTSPTTQQPGASVPNGMNLQYAYDSFGNMTTYGSFTPTYNAKNQMNGFAYDAAGNLLQTGTTALTWDAESRISAAGGASYLYDADGNRVESAGVGVTDTVYFGGRPIARLSNGQWTDLIYGPQGLIAEVAGQENAEPQYRLTDHLGTLVGNLGKDNFSQPILTNPMDYTPFGQVFSGNTADPYFFTGKERDTESGLDYFGFRHYSSAMGRWMSPDPSGLAFDDPTNPQSMNLYGYVLNNPLSFTDPDGLECVWDDGSYDSNDDKQTGSHSSCSAQGGAWVDHSYFAQNNMADWSGSGNSDLAGIASAITSNSTTVNVNADGSGSSMTTNYGYDSTVGVYYTKQDTSQGPDKINALAKGVTDDANHQIGCIAQAYGLGGPGETARYMGQPVEGTKPFITPGTSRGSSPISEYARSLPRVKGNFRAPVGGLGTGTDLRLARTGSLNVAAARWAPFVGLALDALAVGQLMNCLAH